MRQSTAVIRKCGKDEGAVPNRPRKALGSGYALPYDLAHFRFGCHSRWQQASDFVATDEQDRNGDEG
jgi:hypothetical protein